MDEMERQLQCSLVAYVGGSRPAVSCDQVADALVHGANIPRGAFTVHKFKLDDFIIVFASPEFKARVAARASLPFAFFTLFFRQWTRLAQANRVVMRSKVVLEVEGIPPHAWEKEVVQQLVGESCALGTVAPETACREDLSSFRVEAWSVDPELIPSARELWVPEPSQGVETAGSSRAPRPVRRDCELGLLQYDVLIHVSRIEEFVRLDGPEDGRSAVAARRRDGGPRRPGGTPNAEGFWTSRSLAWLPGVPDRRGAHAGGAGHRSAAGSCWRLPHLEAQIGVPQRIVDQPATTPAAPCVGQGEE
jgi:hypothetical protein